MRNIKVRNGMKVEKVNATAKVLKCLNNDLSSKHKIINTNGVIAKGWKIIEITDAPFFNLI